MPDLSLVTSPDTSRCRLLELPWELRHRIFGFAVVVSSPSDRVKIGTSGYNRTGLIRACKMTRRESFRIYYTSNYFEITITNYDATESLRFFDCLSVKHSTGLCFLKQGDSVRLRAPTITVCPVAGEPSLHWNNLMDWLKQLHHRPGLRWSHENSELGPVTTRIRAYQVKYDGLKSMFEIARDLQDLPWSRVKMILNHMRPGLVRAEPLFAEVDGRRA